MAVLYAIPRETTQNTLKTPPKPLVSGHVSMYIKVKTVKNGVLGVSRGLIVQVSTRARARVNEDVKTTPGT